MKELSFGEILLKLASPRYTKLLLYVTCIEV